MPKRQVSYNQEAVLCPRCTKRIRLNNNGRLRVHLAGKMGSAYCEGSNTDPHPQPVVVVVPEPAPAEELAQALFSDL